MLLWGGGVVETAAFDDDEEVDVAAVAAAAAPLFDSPMDNDERMDVDIICCPIREKDFFETNDQIHCPQKRREFSSDAAAYYFLIQ